MKKKILFTVALVVSTVIFFKIFSNWKDFKNGLEGKPPTEEATMLDSESSSQK